MKNIFLENKNTFEEFIKKDNNVVAVYLFGSYADNTFNEKSDIDIAVLYKDNNLDVHLKNQVEAEKIFNNISIDYINLNDAGLFFKFSILKKGKLIYLNEKYSKYFYEEYLRKIQDNYIEMSYSKKKYDDYILNHSSLEG